MEYNTTFTILFDRDEELFYCKVGELNGALHYTVWGNTKPECRQRAMQLVDLLHSIKE